MPHDFDSGFAASDPLSQLPIVFSAPELSHEKEDSPTDEKADHTGKDVYPASSDSHLETKSLADSDDVAFLNGEPVITTGRDVSKYLVDVRDDRDPALTFRSFFLGTVFAGLGAALCQVCTITNILPVRPDVLTALVQIYLFKPVEVSVSRVFLLLLIYSVGVAWSIVVPRGSSVQGTRFARLAPILDFINPGEFRLKEVR